jgi:hypothetical protein
LHLRPQAQTAHESASDGQGDEALHPLPSNKTVVQLFSDYMKYLLECAKQYISDARVDAQKEFRKKITITLQPGMIPLVERIPLYLCSGESRDSSWIDEEPGTSQHPALIC